MYRYMIMWSPLLWWEFGKGKHYLWNSRHPIPWESGTAQGDEVTLQEEWWPDDKVLHQPCPKGGDHKCNWGDAHQGKKQLYVEWAVCTVPPIHNAILIILLHSRAAWNLHTQYTALARLEAEYRYQVVSWNAAWLRKYHPWLMAYNSDTFACLSMQRTHTSQVHQVYS